MADQWYYARDANKLGPFSAQQLLDLANAGQIQPTDTVWKGGIEKGVLAGKVKNLFPAAQQGTTSDTVSSPPAAPPAASPSPTAIPPSDILPSAPVPGEPPPAPAATPTPAPPASPQKTAKKGRAIAIRGAIIVSQDGETAYYRKKCIKCGHEGASKNRLPIKNGTSRLSFYCPKCRKLQKVEIQGVA